MSFSSPPNLQQFQAAVWEIARQVPSRKVTTYGQIAAMIRPPGSLNLKDYEAFGARWVGAAMANCPADVPWQRVINSQGKISQRLGAEIQRQLLEQEEVEFDEKGKVSLDLFGWPGPDPEWCRDHGFFIPKPPGKPQRALF